MKYGTVAGIDKPVSRLVQGTIPVGSKEPEKSYALMDAVLEQGGNTFDTAHIYGGGDNERVFGRWLRDRGARERVVIIGKGAHHNQDRKRVTPFDITADLHDSLARMQVEHIDLYLLHRDDPETPVGPIVEVLNEHARAGKIGAFGGSNWSHDRVREANAYAGSHGLIPFAASSPQFSLAEQVKEPWSGCISVSGVKGRAAREYYRETNLPLFTWSSLAGGFLSGRLNRNNLEEFSSGMDKLAVDCYAVDANFARLDRAAELAARREASIPQIALAWVLCQPLNVFALTGCKTGSEFATNAAALDIDLTPQELEYLSGS